jgi:hypothetical protein
MNTQEAAGQVLEFIRQHRKAFDMHSWADYNNSIMRKNSVPSGFQVKLENIEQANTRCGTTLCVAGFATMATGWTQSLVKYEDHWGGWYDFNWISPGGAVVNDGEVPFEKIGRGYLELTEHQGNVLFFTFDNGKVEGWLERLASGESPDFLNDIYTGECINCEICGAIGEEDR